MKQSPTSTLSHVDPSGHLCQRLEFWHTAPFLEVFVMPNDHELLPSTRHRNVKAVRTIQEADPPGVSHRQKAEVRFPPLETIDGAAANLDVVDDKAALQIGP